MIFGPWSNATALSYPNANTTESVLPFNGSNSAVDVLTKLDGLGRQYLNQTRQSPSSSSFDTRETDFDPLGRVSRTTLPYSGTAGQTNPTGPGQTISYDSLSRTTQIQDAGGGTQTFSYNQNDVFSTLSPAPTGENVKRKQQENDALGRLVSVCEVTSAAGSGTCGQTSPLTGYFTQYSYDSLDHITSVTQNAQGPAGSQQTRSYQYDSLGRLTQEQNPESGTTRYTYDSDPQGACTGSYSGDLVKRVDAAGNTACYTYDALHRVTSMTYSGPNSTPAKHFVYDSATVSGVAMANAKGRLAEAYTCAGSCTTKLTDLGLSYSARGEVTDTYEATPNSGTYCHVAASHWANGMVDQMAGVPGVPTLSYSPDGEGRIGNISVPNGQGQNPLSGTSYNAAGLLNSLSLGSGDADTFEYDSKTLRTTQYQASINQQTAAATLAWNANGTLASLSMTDPFNGANNQSCSFTYDDLGRIQSANCGTAWQQTFGYDPFGNITKSGSSSFAATYSSATNQFSLPGTTVSYDANGNLLYDGSHNYTWNADGRPASIDANGLTYDALGRMVEQQTGANSYRQVVYTPDGQKMAILSGQSLVTAYVPLAAGAQAVYNSTGLAYYRHPDWLGSARLASTPARQVYSDVAYASFGEPYAQSGAGDLSFTGQNQDTAAGLYDFLFREQSPTQGRWISPDPAGLGAVDPATPQSWNRYAYVANNPTSFTDSLGLFLSGLPPCDPLGLNGPFCCDPESILCQGPIVPIIPIPIGGGGGGGGGSPTPPGHLGGETLGIPSGLHLRPPDPLSALLPTDPGCDFGVCVAIGDFQTAEAVRTLPRFGPIGLTLCGGFPAGCAIAIGIIPEALQMYLTHKLVEKVISLGRMTKCTLHDYDRTLRLCVYQCDDGLPEVQVPPGGDPISCPEVFYRPWRGLP